MRRSVINAAYREARDCFQRRGWALPPRPRWDVTDFGLGDFPHFGLVLVNLATEPEYCEKLMYARRDQVTPCHAHRRKKEDIICRHGRLGLRLWPARPASVAQTGGALSVKIDGESQAVAAGMLVELPAGSRITLLPGVWHAFQPRSEDCIIGEVSTANDDVNDNFFLDPAVGRFPGIEEDAPAEVRLVSE